MAKIFEITNDIKKIASDAIDDLIDQLGKACILYYPPTWEACSCSDPIGKKGSNIWSTGGPSPISGPINCGLCNSTGRKAIHATETVQFLCNWNINAFQTIKGVDIRLRQSGSIVQTKGYITDLPKILRCEFALFQVPMLGNISYKFKLASEPSDTNNIVQNRYFQCIWMRDG